MPVYFFCNFFLSDVPTPVQTGKLREETNEDMSIAKAITIVMDRNPHLRFVISNFCLPPAVSTNIPVIFNWFFTCSTGKKGLLMKFFSGICAVWRVGLPQMPIQSLYKAGTRYAFL